MGVISVVNVLTSENWAGAKPDDYKGTELDKALQAWGTLANQTVEIPQDLIPAPPECKVRVLTSYVDELKSVIKELDKSQKLVNQYITALKAVQAAGNKAAADLTKLSQGKNVDEAKQQMYTRAATTATSIASSASMTTPDVAGREPGRDSLGAVVAPAGSCGWTPGRRARSIRPRCPAPAGLDGRRSRARRRPGTRPRAPRRAAAARARRAHGPLRR